MSFKVHADQIRLYFERDKKKKKGCGAFIFLDLNGSPTGVVFAALDAGLWRQTADGGVDIPPTLEIAARRRHSSCQNSAYDEEEQWGLTTADRLSRLGEGRTDEPVERLVSSQLDSSQPQPELLTAVSSG